MSCEDFEMNQIIVIEGSLVAGLESVLFDLIDLIHFDLNWADLNRIELGLFIPPKYFRLFSRVVIQFIIVNSNNFNALFFCFR